MMKATSHVLVGAFVASLALAGVGCSAALEDDASGSGAELKGGIPAHSVDGGVSGRDKGHAYGHDKDGSVDEDSDADVDEGIDEDTDTDEGVDEGAARDGGPAGQGKGHKPRT